MGKGARNRELRRLALVAHEMEIEIFKGRSPKSIARRMRKTFRTRFIQGSR